MSPDESYSVQSNLPVFISSFVSIFFNFLLVLSCLTAWRSLACCIFLFYCFFTLSVCVFFVGMLWGVGRTTSQQVEGCLLLQNSMAFWEWDKAPPPPVKPPKKSFSACCLVCGGLPFCMTDFKHS